MTMFSSIPDSSDDNATDSFVDSFTISDFDPPTKNIISPFLIGASVSLQVGRNPFKPPSSVLRKEKSHNPMAMPTTAKRFNILQNFEQIAKDSLMKKASKSQVYQIEPLKPDNILLPHNPIFRGYIGNEGTPEKGNEPHTYILNTTRKYRDTGKTAHYELNDINMKHLLDIKQNRNHPRIFDITLANDEEIIASIIMSEDKQEFSLRKYNKRGPEVLFIKYFPLTHHKFRKVHVTFMMVGSGRKPQRLRSREPPRDIEGKPIFDFNGASFIESNRNLVLYSRHQDKNYVFVRKTEANEYQIDAMFHAHILCLAAIVFSDAVSPVC
ncbi:hypothetical protein TRFO_26541 [Tritrichomonas foetus]|uniref:Tubby C-terminal domain-containing protein n=1 Tax=Tritrichomonas foetus TaxID=1144522 RepID=A0A1J4K7G1_9EUKA|nr:hypothetical protein TRFO_26541 [Tritrichomonas foetus]|eukprot:OHT05652.1 hypothetical protein TRFO_26541 [Tritrichomonas foetus]